MLTFLVDGYNLMHAAGLADGRPRERFRRARVRFLDWLADADPVRARRAAVKVVFDAVNGPFDEGDTRYRNLLIVRFAYRLTADDMIERLLALTASPAGVAVVSNDNRVREAARRRGAQRWSCEAFMDWLLIGSPGPGAEVPPPPAEPEKPDGPPPPDERAELLSAFALPRR